MISIPYFNTIRVQGFAKDPYPSHPYKGHRCPPGSGTTAVTVNPWAEAEALGSHPTQDLDRLATSQAALEGSLGLFPAPALNRRPWTCAMPHLWDNPAFQLSKKPKKVHLPTRPPRLFPRMPLLRQGTGKPCPCFTCPCVCLDGSNRQKNLPPVVASINGHTVNGDTACHAIVAE